MRAVTYDRYGGPENLKFGEVDKPALKDNGLLIRVHAVSLNRSDWESLVGMPATGDTLTLPATAAVFSGKRLVGSKVGDAQVLRDFPRYIRLAEAGKVDLGSMVSRRIELDEVNDGIESLRRAEGVRTVIV